MSSYQDFFVAAGHFNNISVRCRPYSSAKASQRSGKRLTGWKICVYFLAADKRAMPVVISPSSVHVTSPFSVHEIYQSIAITEYQYGPQAVQLKVETVGPRSPRRALDIAS